MMTRTKPKQSFPQWDFELDAPISVVAFGPDAAMFALGDGTIRLLRAGESKYESAAAHSGAILCGALDTNGNGILTGGGDGRLVHTLADGQCNLVASTGGRWVEHVAVHPKGALSWSHGRTVELAFATQESRFEFDLTSSCGGLAYEPNAERLAAAHYGGVVLLGLEDGQLTHDQLEWKGSHIAVSWSPDTRFLVSAMQEAALHVWRLSDKRDLHMAGYPAKPRHLAWLADGLRLATSGGPGALTWRFDGEAGPEGHVAELLGQRDELATAIAWHPVSPVLAVGFRDGLVSLVEPGSDRAPIIRVPDGDMITGLAWKPDGRVLAWGTEKGSAALIDLSKVET